MDVKIEGQDVRRCNMAGHPRMEWDGLPPIEWDRPTSNQNLDLNRAHICSTTCAVRPPLPAMDVERDLVCEATDKLVTEDLRSMKVRDILVEDSSSWEIRSNHFIALLRGLGGFVKCTANDCNAVFFSLEEYYLHSVVAHGRTDFCIFCAKVFGIEVWNVTGSASGICEHDCSIQQSPAIGPPGIVQQQYMCPCCGETKPNHNELLFHMYKRVSGHAGLFPHQSCTFCFAILPSVRCVPVHMLFVHGTTIQPKQEDRLRILGKFLEEKKRSVAAHQMKDFAEAEKYMRHSWIVAAEETEMISGGAKSTKNDDEWKVEQEEEVVCSAKMKKMLKDMIQAELRKEKDVKRMKNKKSREKRTAKREKNRQKNQQLAGKGNGNEKNQNPNRIPLGVGSVSVGRNAVTTAATTSGSGSNILVGAAADYIGGSVKGGKQTVIQTQDDSAAVAQRVSSDQQDRSELGPRPVSDQLPSTSMALLWPRLSSQDPMTMSGCKRSAPVTVEESEPQRRYNLRSRSKPDVL